MVPFCSNSRCASRADAARSATARDALDVDLDQLARVLGERATSRDHDGERFSDEPHFILGDYRLDEPFETLDRSETDRNGGNDVADIGGGEDRLDAGTSIRRAQVDAANTPVSHRTAHDRRVQQTLGHDIGNEGAAPSEQPRVLDPLERLTHIGVGLDRHRSGPGGPAYGRLDGVNWLSLPRLAAIFVLIATSACTSFSNADVVRIIGSAPRRASFSCTAGFCSALRVSAYSLSRMGDGVFDGANIPTQKLYSELGNPASTVVGTSGSAAARCDPLTASA